MMLTYATKKFSTGANGQKGFPLCPRSFDRAATDWLDTRLDSLPPTGTQWHPPLFFFFFLRCIAPHSNAPPGGGSYVVGFLTSPPALRAQSGKGGTGGGLVG